MVLAAVWYLGTFLLSRRYGINTKAGIKASIWHLTAPIGLLLAVGSFFAFMIYLQPQAGYMRSIVCLDRETGKILWNRHGFHAAASRRFPSNSYATPTPVTDGRYIVAHYGPGMVCTDLEGSVKWIKTEPNHTKHLRYGAGASPIMFLNKVIYPFMAEFSGNQASFGNVSDSYLAAFDQETGEFRCRSNHLGHTTLTNLPPNITQHKERPVVMMGTWGHALSYDPHNGELLWSCKVL